MQDPKWENSQFVASFRSIDASVERFPADCDENSEAFDDLARAVDRLDYEGYIVSPSDSYQVNLSFDQRIVERLCLTERKCISEPVLNAPRQVARAVGQKADLLIGSPGTGGMIVVEVEKANKEKILRDMVKILLFIDAGQADLGVLICPRNYAHAKGIWRVFDTASQVLRSFVHVTQLPDTKARRLALIGFTQEIFLEGIGGAGIEILGWNFRGEPSRISRGPNWMLTTEHASEPLPPPTPHRRPKRGNARGTIPTPSFTAIIRSHATPVSRVTMPLGQRISSKSIFVRPPRPKCSRGSWAD